MTMPAFLQGADAEERAELGALGISLTPPVDAGAAALDAWASDLLRALGDVESDRARYEESRQAEHARIDMRYAASMERLDARAATIRTALHALALEADFGKKKSRDVGYGTYGRRTVPEKLSVVDAAALLAFAEEQAPALVRTVEKRDVPHAAVKEYVKSTGDVPPGVELVPAREEPFAKAVRA